VRLCVKTFRKHLTLPTAFYIQYRTVAGRLHANCTKMFRVVARNELPLDVGKVMLRNEAGNKHNLPCGLYS